MQTLRLKIAGALLALAALVGGLSTDVIQPKELFGSLTEGQSYTSTTTNTQALFRNYTVIQGRSAIGNLSPVGTRVATSAPTVLGSLVITTTGTSPFCLYDATSTVPNGEWATTTIACFPASPTVGTYVFDAQFQKGILVEWTGSPTITTRASTTITFR